MAPDLRLIFAGAAALVADVLTHLDEGALRRSLADSLEARELVGVEFR